MTVATRSGLTIPALGAFQARFKVAIVHIYNTAKSANCEQRSIDVQNMFIKRFTMNEFFWLVCLDYNNTITLNSSHFGIHEKRIISRSYLEGQNAISYALI